MSLTRLRENSIRQIAKSTTTTTTRVVSIYTGVSVSEFGYRDASVSEQGRGSRYPNKKSSDSLSKQNLSELFKKKTKMALSQLLS